MKIVVIGGTGLIGSKVVERLRKRGHDVLVASPAAGINTITGEGLGQAMVGAEIVIDVANSPSFEDRAVLEFFETSSRNIAVAEKRAGVRHHLALSVVGTDRLAASGYFRGKIAQERIIRESGVPYTIVHATQFFEFLSGIAKSASGARGIHLPSALMQPIASDDVADAVTDYALGAPRNGVVEIAGPERFSMATLVRRFLALTHDAHEVITDDTALYFGARLGNETLLPSADARLGGIDFESWFEHAALARNAMRS